MYGYERCYCYYKKIFLLLVVGSCVVTMLGTVGFFRLYSYYFY